MEHACSDPRLRAWRNLRRLCRSRRVVSGTAKHVTLLLMAALFVASAVGPGLASAPLHPESSDGPERLLLKAEQALTHPVGVVTRVDIDAIEDERRFSRSLLLTAKRMEALAETLRPVEMQGQLSLRKEGRIWKILPGLIAPTLVSPRQRLVGPVAYANIAALDFMGRYRVAHVADDDAYGEPCVLITLEGVEGEGVYPVVKCWISKPRTLRVKTSYYGEGERLLKTVRLEYGNTLQLDGETRPFISRMTIKGSMFLNAEATLVWREPRVLNVPDNTFDLYAYVGPRGVEAARNATREGPVEGPTFGQQPYRLP